MPSIAEVPFILKLNGGDAERHELPAYDGYMALAGFGLSLSLVTNYVETGKIRRRRDFVGRAAVKAKPIEEGSVLSEFTVYLSQAAVIGGAISAGVATNFLKDIVKRTIDRNLGVDSKPETDELEKLEKTSGGDLAALVAATEPAIRQAHTVIGNGAQVVNIYGGKHTLGRFDAQSKLYVDSSVQDPTIRQKDVSVASFNVNSGYGGVFDSELGRVVPIQLTKDTLARAKQVLSWGLNEYAKGTGKKISLRFFSYLALDDRVKKYIVVDAEMLTN